MGDLLRARSCDSAGAARFFIRAALGFLSTSNANSPWTWCGHDSVRAGCSLLRIYFAYECYLSARRSKLKADKKEHCLELLNFSHRLCNDCRGSWEEKYGNNSDLMFLISVPEDDGEQTKTVLEISALAALL